MAAREFLILATLVVALILAGFGVLNYGEVPRRLSEVIDVSAPAQNPTDLPVIGLVRDDYTDQPIEGATVILGDKYLTTDGEGQFLATQADDGVSLDISAAGHDRLTVRFDKSGPLQFPLRPNVLRGRIVDDQDGRPLSHVSVISGERSTATDARDYPIRAGR